MAVLFVSALLVFLQTFATAQESCTAVPQSTCENTFDAECREGFLFQEDHIFPEEEKILLDTSDYTSLFTEDIERWTSMDYDGDDKEVHTIGMFFICLVTNFLNRCELHV